MPRTASWTAVYSKMDTDASTLDSLVVGEDVCGMNKWEEFFFFFFGQILRCHIIWMVGWGKDSRVCFMVQIKDSPVCGVAP